jgi:hypothetical protein
MFARVCISLAALIGIGAFFAPLVHVSQDGHEMAFSAFAMVQGVDAMTASVDGPALPPEFADSLNASLSEMRGPLLVPFAPAAIFALLALSAFRRFGRGHGVLALLTGLAGLGLWAIIQAAVKDSSTTRLASGLAITLVAASAGAGTLAGLTGLFKPDPKIEPPKTA